MRKFFWKEKNIKKTSKNIPFIYYFSFSPCFLFFHFIFSLFLIFSFSFSYWCSSPHSTCIPALSTTLYLKVIVTQLVDGLYLRVTGGTTTPIPNK